MKTKIAYAVTSSSDDVFWEQFWVSAWSLKHYNPTAFVVVATDKETYEAVCLSYRKESLSLIDRVIPIEFEKNYTKMQRSRWLKIKLHELVHDDLLYVDSDTVITADISEIDLFNFDIGFVYDMHSNPRAIPVSSSKYKYAFDCDLEENVPFYNGGLFYAKNSKQSDVFFSKWFDNWVMADNKLGYKDQLPLVKTVADLNNPVTPISGIFNCQPLSGIKYLYSAKIVHFFNNPWLFHTQIHPLMQKETYESIKDNQRITKDFELLILNCKSEFSDISSPVGVEEAVFIRTPITRYLYYLYKNNNHIFQKLNRFSVRMVKFFEGLHLLKKT